MKKINFRGFDKGLFLAPILIFTIGILSIYSASFKSAQAFVETLAVRQMLWMGIGVLAVFLIVRTSYLLWQDLAWPLYFLSLLCLVAVLFAPARLGAHRWLQVAGLHFQPSELAKISVVLALARFFAGRRYEHASKNEILLAFLIVAAPFLLILKEPDLGTGLLLGPAFLAMLYLWGMRGRTILLFAAVALAASPFLIGFLKEYQRTRLLVFMNPNLDPLGAGYTIIQSKIAIGSGGLWGKGFMGGTQNVLKFLPERHTDFIFSVIAEEGGLAVSLVVLALFLFIIKKGYTICGQTHERFGRQLACGITTMLVYQTVINLGMTMGIFPVVGVPLPLVSYGGTSILTTMLSIALLLNIKIHRPTF